MAAFFTACSMPLVWRALSTPEAFTSPVSTGAFVSLTLAVFALNAILLALVVNRWTVRVVLPALLLINAGAVYFAWTYGVVIDTSMMRNVIVTDTREATEYLTPGLGLALLVLGVVPALVVARMPLRRRPLRSAAVSGGLQMLGLLCVLMLALVSSFDGLASLMRGHKHVRYLISPANVMVSAVRAFNERGRRGGPRQVISARPRQAPHPPGSKPHVLVLVIGETARAANWGLSGYKRQTTPELARRDVVNFTDVTACGSSTEVSLPCMFSMQGRHEYDATGIARSESLLHVLARAGVAMLWRDNQTGCKGVCDGLPFESFRKARDPLYCTADGCRDEILLHGLEARLKSTRRDSVIVLHQLGNHGPAYYRRYEADMRRYRPDCRTADLTRCTQVEVINAYDNAVLATDRMLARTIDLLAANPSVDSAMVYVSDHGESLGESGLYLHGIPYPIAPDEQLKVPMVMWFSPGMQASRGIDLQCVRTQASRPTDHDSLFHTVMGLLEVHAEPYQKSHDLVGSCAGDASRPSGVTASPRLSPTHS